MKLDWCSHWKSLFISLNFVQICPTYISNLKRFQKQSLSESRIQEKNCLTLKLCTLKSLYRKFHYEKNYCSNLIFSCQSIDILRLASKIQVSENLQYRSFHIRNHPIRMLYNLDTHVRVKMKMLTKQYRQSILHIICNQYRLREWNWTTQQKFILKLIGHPLPGHR